ncbi:MULTISPECIES: YidB family protein [Rhodomicrobium]|uniref:YidB family protein n=1 Tax=Rhodomicrobium TaxID=1068 RepID=UPI001FDAAAE7|nr:MULTISPECIES: YidB family protein [Rhodomicrobium]
MGMLDEVMNKVSPDGKMPGSILEVLASLLTGQQQPAQGGTPNQPMNPPQGMPRTDPQADGHGGMPEGGLFGGLAELLAKLQSAGESKTVDTWVADGANAPIEPEKLETALGQRTVASLARQAGVSEQELLAKLATVLPGVVDKLTPNGNVPTPEQIAAYLARR